MNRAETAEAAKVMQAWLDGEPIQHRPRTGPYWLALLEPSWSWGLCDYRIKPAPRIVSWTAETFPKDRPVWVKEKGNHSEANNHMITRWCASGCRPQTERFLTWEVLANNFTQHDGSACGTIEEGVE